MSQGLVVLGELPSTVKEDGTDVSLGRELPVVIAGFSFWPGMDCSRQQTKQLFLSVLCFSSPVLLFTRLLSKLEV